MKKFVKIALISAFIATSVFVFTSSSKNKLEANNIEANNKNYLVVGKNYYTDNTIEKGFLNQTIATVLVNDVATLNKLKETYGDTVANKTVLQFYSENGYSPEDRYATWPTKVTDLNGRLANSSVKQPDPVTTFEFPYKMYEKQVGAEKLGAKLPNLFARLTVGSRPDIFTRKDYTWKFFREIMTENVQGLEVMQNFLGYGHHSTVDDFILNQDNGYNNNIVIPTRYNTERDDVYLTMRGGSPDRYNSFLLGARAFLTATSESGLVLGNGEVAVDDKNSNHYYINTTTKIGVTDAGFQAMGNEPGKGKFLVGKERAFEKANQLLVNQPIVEFNNDVNENLERLENVANRINLGVGGQIQLRGLYRTSRLDTDYTADQVSREKDSVHTTNVEYYMYQENTNELYSPNKSKFDIETTRPYFVDFNDLKAVINYDKAQFDTLVGIDSYNVMDNGITPDGAIIRVDENRVRVRIQDGVNLSPNSYTLEELKAELDSEKYDGKTLKLVYTYAATDAQDSILGLVPSEIITKSGAYAVPIVRTIVMPKKPVDTPTKPPVDTPTKPPVDTPTKPPVDTPTKPPVDTPTKPPVDTPVKPPVEKQPNPATIKEPVNTSDYTYLYGIVLMLSGLVVLKLSNDK